MQPYKQTVTTPLCICDAFTDGRFKGNPAAVCFVPSSVYCMEWSAVDSLEASIGRGEPVPQPTAMTEEERAAASEKYAEECDKKMGRAFQQVAMEMGMSETAFVYRLPAARVQTIENEIRAKVKEYDSEYESELKKKAEEAMMEDDNGAIDDNTQEETKGGKKMDAPGLIPSSSFSLGGFNASFLDARSGSVLTMGKPASRRLHAQWFGLRWFSPKTEVPLCGHATIAAAHSIYEIAQLYSNESTRFLVDNIPPEFFIPAHTDVLCFVTCSGVISVRRRSNTGIGNMRNRDVLSTQEKYEVHFPGNEARSVQEHLPAPFKGKLAEALGLPYGEEVIEDVALSAKGGYYVARLAKVRNVYECKANPDALMALFKEPQFLVAMKNHTELAEPKGLVVTAQVTDDKLSGPAANADIISRFFAPWLGVAEDPVTGSAYTVITAYWLRIRQQGSFKIGDRLQCYQASARGGSLTSIIIGRKADRIALVGDAMMFMRGTCAFEVTD